MQIKGRFRKRHKKFQKHPVTLWYYKTFKSGKLFSFAGRKYHYFYHKYNRTWMNERAVEVPIVWDYVTRFRGKRILEIGNILSHYFPVTHDVVDKYEQARGVINKDVIDYSPGHGYDLIVSISTLEHVGWDEESRDPEKILRTIKNLKDLLNPGGLMIVTLSLGYNPLMDDLLKEGRLRFERQHFLKRISGDNRWKEVEWADVEGAAYDSPYFYANAIIIGFMEGTKTSGCSERRTRR